jgi:nucleoside-diphosphate-sugar epimerase
MANYVVTGAAGFIGSNVARQLLEEGHFVLGIDELNAAYDPRIKEWRKTKLDQYQNFSFVKQDISQLDVMKEICGGRQYDAVFNLAARAGVRASVENPHSFVDTNMTGTLNMLEICKCYDIPKFILASTSSVYGKDAPSPTPEDAETSFPLQPYAASKKGAEAMCHAYHFLFGIDVTIFRYFTVYGPAGRPDMVMFRFGKWITEGEEVVIFGDGEQTRGFTYVDDIASGTIKGLKKTGFQIINLGGHESISINTLVEMMEGMIGKKAQTKYYPAQKADMRSNLADVSKAKALLDWNPKVTLQDGIQNLVDWYQQERDWVKELEL